MVSWLYLNAGLKDYNSKDIEYRHEGMKGGLG